MLLYNTTGRFSFYGLLFYDRSSKKFKNWLFGFWRGSCQKSGGWFSLWAISWFLLQTFEKIYKFVSRRNCRRNPPDKLKKVYLGNAEGIFKERFYNHRNSFNNDASTKITTLSKYIWKLKEAANLSPTLHGPLPKWYNLIQIYPRSFFCLFMKNSKKLIFLNEFVSLIIINDFEIFVKKRIADKRSELISKRCHTSKF